MIELIVEGKTFTQFKAVSVTKSLDSLGGGFEILVSNEVLSDFPINFFDDVSLRVDGLDVINGYINMIQPSYDSNTHTVSFGGNDKSIDVAKTSVRSNTQYKGEMSLKDFVENAIIDNGILNIDVIDDSGADGFTSSETMSSETGDNLFNFIDKYARKKGVILNSDGKGNLIIYRNTGIVDDTSELGIILRNKLNDKKNKYIISASGGYDMSNRYRFVLVKSQNTFDELVKIGDGVEDIQGVALDGDVTKRSFKVIVSDTASDISSCQEQARWEVNNRRAKSLSYNATVQGFRAPNGRVWEVGLIASIDDDYANIQSNMILNNITYNYSLEGGSTCDLEFLANDAYKVQSEDPTSNTNKVADDIFSKLGIEDL